MKKEKEDVAKLDGMELEKKDLSDARDVLKVAKSMYADPDLRRIFDRVKNSELMDDDEQSKILHFGFSYFRKLEKDPPDDVAVATTLLRLLASNELENIESPEAWDYVKKNVRWKRYNRMGTK